MNENMNNNKGGFNRKIYLTILWIFTIACILVGTIMHVVRPGFNFLRNLPGIHFGSNSEQMHGEMYDTTFHISDDIEVIEINCDIADLTIRSGSEFTVQTLYPEELEPEVNATSNMLSIDQHSNTTNFSAIDDDCSIILTIPDTVSLNRVDINVSFGDINIDNLVCDDLHINVDMGGIELSDITADTLEITNSMGDINGSWLSFNNGTAECSMGSISIVNSTFDFIEANCSMGSIDITGDFERAELDCDLGSAYASSENREAVVIINGNTMLGTGQTD